MNILREAKLTTKWLSRYFRKKFVETMNSLIVDGYSVVNVGTSQTRQSQRSRPNRLHPELFSTSRQWSIEPYSIIVRLTVYTVPRLPRNGNAHEEPKRGFLVGTSGIQEFREH